MTVLIALLALTLLALYRVTRSTGTSLTPSPMGSAVGTVASTIGSTVPPRATATVSPWVLPPHVTVWIPEADVAAYIRAQRARVLLSAPAGDGGYYVTVTR